MRIRHQSITSSLLIALLLLQSLSTPLQAGFPELFNNKGKKPQPVVMDVAMERLAKNLDWLESHINEYGSIAPKMPDVWGEARLTKHRQEYEKEMAKDIGGFKDTLQAAISRSDQAYLASAFALQAAVGSGAQDSRIPRRAGDKIVTVVEGAKTTTETTTGNSTGLLAGSSVFTANPNLDSDKIGFAAPGNGGISLEPTAILDQKSRYLQHLNQLRRINEGDDTADSPGYALNLVRIPVSVLPGAKTRKGHAAEITFTMKPYVSDELLPITFRQLVINDVVDTLSHPLLQAIFVKHQENAVKAIIETRKKEKIGLTSLIRNEIVKINGLINPSTPDEEKKSLESFRTQLLTLLTQLDDKQYATRIEYTELSRIETFYKSKQDFNKALSMLPIQSNVLKTGVEIQTAKEALDNIDEIDSKNLEKRIQEINDEFKKFQDQEQAIAQSKNSIEIQIASIASSASGMRKGRFPVPPSQLQNVGRAGFQEPITNLPPTANRVNGNLKNVSNKTKNPEILPHPVQLDNQIALDLEAAIEAFANAFPDLKQDDVKDINDPKINAKFGKNILDMHRILTEEVAAAYDLLSVRHQLIEQSIWYSQSSFIERVGTAIRLNNAYDLNRYSTEFTQLIEQLSGQRGIRLSNATTFMAWAILVESAVLNQRLIEDMREATISKKGCRCQCNEQSKFYGPNPPVDARQAFKEYVLCRWPIHVFALDPVNQEQNVADSFFMKREMQLAMSLAFASGKINAQSMTQYARKIELSMDTVALNRTIVGFSHGEDTFGWRFYPRVQTPDIESNAVVLGRDLIWGGPNKDHLKKDLELESGMRECTAIVIMPSFVPYVTLESHSNWFCTTHPRQTAMTTSQTMELSRAVRNMHETATQVCRSDLYRDGELDRLVNRVQQLDRELPTQSQVVQVPYENTLGGFEMFSGGVSALAPELIGWYAEPGVFVNEQSQLVLVGDHFSLHDTQVIIGNRIAKEVKMLSRRMLLVTVDKDAQYIMEDANPVAVDIHVATPYGVTGHISVPVSKRETKTAATEPNNWKPSKVALLANGQSGLLSEPAIRVTIDGNPFPAAPVKLSLGVFVDQANQSNLIHAFELDCVPYSSNDKAFVVEGDNLKLAAQQLIEVRKVNPKLPAVYIKGFIIKDGIMSTIPGKLDIEFK